MDGRIKRGFAVLLVAAFTALALPPANGKANPFSWNREQLWHQLEQQFVEARGNDCQDSGSMIRSRLQALAELTAFTEYQPLGPGDPLWNDIEDRMFRLATLGAACPKHLDRFTEAVARLQRAVKRQAIGWPADAPQTRQRLYRVIYGGRTALEEVLLQALTGDCEKLYYFRALRS